MSSEKKLHLKRPEKKTLRLKPQNTLHLTPQKNPNHTDSVPIEIAISIENNQAKVILSLVKSIQSIHYFIWVNPNKIIENVSMNLNIGHSVVLLDQQDILQKSLYVACYISQSNNEHQAMVSKTEIPLETISHPYQVELISVTKEILDHQVDEYKTKSVQSPSFNIEQILINNLKRSEEQVEIPEEAQKFIDQNLNDPILQKTEKKETAPIKTQQQKEEPIQNNVSSQTTEISPKHPEKKSSRLFITVLVLLLLSVLGGVAFFFLENRVIEKNTNIIKDTAFDDESEGTEKKEKTSESKKIMNDDLKSTSLQVGKPTRTPSKKTKQQTIESTISNVLDKPKTDFKKRFEEKAKKKLIQVAENKYKLQNSDLNFETLKISGVKCEKGTCKGNVAVTTY